MNPLVICRSYTDVTIFFQGTCSLVCLQGFPPSFAITLITGLFRYPAILVAFSPPAVENSAA